MKKKKIPKISRRKEIIKIQADINEKDMKETIVKITKTKSQFFENITKLTNLQPDSSRKKDSTQNNERRNEKGEITTNTTEI